MRQGNNKYCFQIHYLNNALSLPPHSYKATVEPQTHTRARFTGWGKHSSEEETEFSYKVNLHEFPLKNTVITDSKQYLAHQLHSNSLLAVCDGSYIKNDAVGAAVWIIETGNRSASIDGSLVVSKNGATQNAYRSKLFGILGTLITIQKICSKFNLESGMLNIHCNGESAVK